jgi:hypothetical protein
MPFYETKPHPDRESALNRAHAIYRNPGWGLKVLFIEQWVLSRLLEGGVDVRFADLPTIEGERSRDVLPKINSNGRRVSVRWFTGVLQSLGSPS